MYIDAATAAILGFHNVLSISSERRLETYGNTTFLRVFIRLTAATTVPGSSKRVLTRFTNGLLRNSYCGTLRVRDLCGRFFFHWHELVTELLSLPLEFGFQP